MNELSEKYLPTGTVIGGSYRLLKCLGEGGMGAIFEVEHVIMGKHFALKLLTKSNIAETDWLRFKQEAQTLSKLQHANIVQVSDLGIHQAGEKKFPFYVMELLQGESLKQRLKVCGRMGAREAVALFENVAKALALVHEKGIIHRDIKPDNIMLVKGDSGITPKLVDFGILKLKDGGGVALTLQGEVFGSPIYMSPEQCMGQSLDPRSDIYALGASLFEALTGVPPLSGENAVETFKLKTSTRAPRMGDKVSLITFDDDLEDLVADMLEMDANHRPPSAAHVVGRLQAIRLMQEMGMPQVPGRKTEQPTGISTEPTRRQAKPAPEAEEPAIEQSLTKKLFLPAVCLVALAAILCALALWQYTAPKSGNAGKTTSQMKDANFVGLPQIEPDNQTGSKPGEERSDWSQLEKIPVICELNSAAGQKQFHLPQTISIGSLRLLKNGRATETIDVRGELRFPADAMISYTPNNLVLEHPELLDKCKDGVLKELVLSNEELVTNDFLKHLTHLKSLATVKLNNTMINDDGLKYLEQLPALDKLEIGTPGVRDKSLSQAKFLLALRHLDLKSQPTISLTLKALAKSDKLQKLVATYCNLSREDWQELARIKPLRELNLGSANLDDRSLEELASLPNLQELEIKDCPVTTDSAKALKRFPKLRFLVIDNEDWTEQEFQDFAKAVAPCRIARDRRSFTNFNLQ
ncbi:MAG: protein kinase [Candidatus Melainabacteria bacterium]|nr:protein kinase [Candidatus Melainabacteria bacterium]